MSLGFGLPQFGPLGVPEAVVTVAKSAQDFGFDSLWVADRMLWPVKPSVPYPIGDGTLPLIYKRPLDLLEMLTFAAAHTRRVALLIAGSQAADAAGFQLFASGSKKQIPITLIPSAVRFEALGHFW